MSESQTPDPLSDPRTLLDELQRSTGGFMDRLRATPDGEPIVAALLLAPDARVRTVLCNALGFRREPGAVDALLTCLRDDAVKVRSAAADALAKIADSRAGEPLLVRAELPEPDDGVRRMVITALGAVGHQPAVPLLIELLGSDDPSMRGSAAWSLGALRAKTAELPLRQALERELSPYPHERMSEALRQIVTR